MNLRALAFSPTLALLFAALPAHAQGAVPAAAPTQPAPVAEGNDVELARQHFSQATKLYKDGDFDAALVQFERAYEVKPNYKVLYNIGQTYFQLRQYVEARDAMQRYVKEGGAQVEGERLAAVTKDLADLEKRIANVTINVNANDATVLVDGKKVGVTPLAGPVAVSEGQRTISVEAPNRGVLQRLIRVAGGEAQTLNLTVEAAQVVVVHTKGPDPKPVHLGPVFWTTAMSERRPTRRAIPCRHHAELPKVTAYTFSCSKLAPRSTALRGSAEESRLAKSLTSARAKAPLTSFVRTEGGGPLGISKTVARHNPVGKSCATGTRTITVASTGIDEAAGRDILCRLWVRRMAFGLQRRSTSSRLPIDSAARRANG